MEATSKELEERQKTQALEKKPYARSRLVVHGTVQDITKDANPSNLDGPLGS